MVRSYMYVLQTVKLISKNHTTKKLQKFSYTHMTNKQANKGDIHAEKEKNLTSLKFVIIKRIYLFIKSSTI